MDNYSTILFARPSFVEGMARAIDIGNTLNEYNAAPTPHMADQYALCADWMAIGADMQAVMSKQLRRPVPSRRKRRRAAHGH